MRRAGALLAAIVVVGGAAVAHAAPTLYVRQNGNDAADGLSPTTALRTIRIAARRLTGTGGKVIVGPGTYGERDISPNLSNKNTSRADALEFVADRDGALTGDPPGPVIVDAAGFSTGFLLVGEKDVLVDGFHVRGATDAGIQVRYNEAGIMSARVTIANCVVYGNAKRGIDVQDTVNAVVFNNLTFGNDSTGISVGGSITGSPDAVIAYNTSYGNGVHGIFVGDGNRSAVVSPNALVLANVVAGNAVSGVKVAASSVATYGSAFNVNRDLFEPASQIDPTDLAAAPLLVNAECLEEDGGGNACLEEDFRVAADSPAIDHGPADAAALGLGGTTRADDSPDLGTADAGYHAGNTTSRFTVPTIPLVPIFVRVGGSDDNDGASAEHALRTIRHAASLARAGNRVIVGAGTYHEGDINVGERSGTKYRPIEFVADIEGSWTGDAGPVVIDAGSNLTGSGGGAASPEFQTGFNILGNSHVMIDGFHVTGAFDDGIQIRARSQPDAVLGADDVTVCNSVVFSNRGRGVAVRDSANAVIFNNLVYANGTGGVAVGGVGAGSPSAKVVNNTVYKNGVHGILVGDNASEDQVGSPGAVVMNNIVDKNGGRSLLVTALSLNDYSGAANLDGALVGALGFIDPMGGDRALGGSGFADDDFRLKQRRAGQASTSSAVDRGTGAAAITGVHLGSTRTDGVVDDGLADVGFHYLGAGNLRPVVGTITPLQARLESPKPQRLRFVSLDGDDRADGYSPASAFRSITAAARAALPGDMVVIAPGRYDEGDVSLARPGRALEPIMLVADTTGNLSGSAPGPIIVDATGNDTGFVLLDRSFVHIRGFHIRGARVAAIQVRPCAGDPSSCPANAGSDHVTIADNVIFSGQRGIDVVDSTDATIFNNLIYANTGTGISITGNQRQAGNAELINNTLYRNGGDGVLLSGDAGAPNATLMHNIIGGSGLLGLETKPSARAGLVLTHNLNADDASAGTPGDDQDLGGNPRFTRPEGADGVLGGVGFADDNFRLHTTLPTKRTRSRRRSTSGSAAIDAGGMEAADVALTSRVARSDGAQDVGRADLGFHYGVLGPLDGMAMPTVTLYVRAQAGNDANDGLTPETALRTIGAAASQAGAGTTIVIGPGVYREGNLRPVGTGTPLHRVVFMGDPDGTRTGDPAGSVLVDAEGAASGFRLAGKSHVRLQGVDVTGARLAGVLAQNTTGLEVANCRVFSNRTAGIMLVRPRGGNSLFNNLIYGNEGDGVQVRLRTVRDSAVRLMHNTVYANGGRGVWIDRSDYRRRLGAVLLAHNVVQSNGSDLTVTPGSWNVLRLLRNVLSKTPDGVASTDELIMMPPAFSNPPGADGILGGDGFADDEFLVGPGNPIVDAGAGAAAEWALERGTVRLDHSLDDGAVDLGYHTP